MTSLLEKMDCRSFENLLRTSFDLRDQNGGITSLARMDPSAPHVP